MVPSVALQPVATRLRELNVFNSYLQGSADGFLTKGWTALTSLCLNHTHLENATVPAALKLPALEDVTIRWFSGHRGGEMQLDQLISGCPQVSCLEFQLGTCLRQAYEASRPSYRLLNLSRLADLHIISSPGNQANVDLDLPPSLTQLKFGGYRGYRASTPVDFFWALQEAVVCIRRGAQLHKLICHFTAVHLQHAQWGASLAEQHRRLGCQLGSLRELEVWGVMGNGNDQLLSAVGAIASAAPSLTRLEIVIMDPPPSVEVSPICSASLESIRVEWRTDLYRCCELRPPQLLLTFLPGCTRLQEVVVVVPFMDGPIEGAAFKIRCHCCSRRCIVPVAVYAKDSWHSNIVFEDEEMYAVVNFVHAPSSKQGVQACTVLYACHADGPEQDALWGHAVMPGIL